MRNMTDRETLTGYLRDLDIRLTRQERRIHQGRGTGGGSGGPQGPPGPPGVGVPSGGAPGEVLGKVGPGDYETDWVTGGGVPTSRLISTTAPLSGGGDLSADRTLAVDDFTTSTRGTVPASGGGSTNYLRADGTWTAPPGGAGTTILSGATPPVDTTGANGDYYLDTAGGVLYGPKVAGGYGTAQTPLISGTPVANQANREAGASYRFTRAGKVTAVRYRRLNTSPGTLTMKAWNDRTQAKAAEVADVQSTTGQFTATFASPVLVGAGEEWTFTVSGTQTPVYGGAQTVTNTTDVTWLRFRDGGAVDAYPANTYINAGAFYAEPVYQPNDSWPASVRQVGGYQPWDSELYQLAQPTLTANMFPYYTTAGVVALATLTAFARSLLDDTSAAEMQNTLGIATGYFPIRRTINAQTGTTYTNGIGDTTKLTTLNNASPITVTLTGTVGNFTIGDQLDFAQLGAGQVTFTAGSGATVNGTPGLKLRAQYSTASAIVIANNTWLVRGDLAA